MSEEPLRSVHTANFPDILTQLGISLLVSTYQAGKLIILRPENGVINTHFRNFAKPMGLSANYRRFCVGTAQGLWEFRNIPEAARKLEPPQRHDACFFPREQHITGDIDVHETAFVDDELWLVNTRFSCLCTLDREHSFTPRWYPPFITQLLPEDRCHLNGLGLRDGGPRYVTALGIGDTARSWRENKARGGMLMDISTNEMLLQGLSMPHSPRWYEERLWFLESGDGALAVFDEDRAAFHTIAHLPGFTRGLDFYGPLAFIGLSQVRESAVFSGIPLTERLHERICGVWVVNILNGETLAFLRFEGAVQEIFAVQVLPGIRFPEIIDWNDPLINTSYIIPDGMIGVLKSNAEK